MKNEHRPTNGPASTMIFFTHNIKIFMFSQRNISHSYKIQVLYGAKITPITNGVKSHTNIPSREAICFFQAKWSVDASFFCRKQNNMQADHRPQAQIQAQNKINSILLNLSFLQCDAMLVQYMRWPSVCPSIRHKKVFYQNGYTMPYDSPGTPAFCRQRYRQNSHCHSCAKSSAICVLMHQSLCMERNA